MQDEELTTSERVGRIIKQAQHSLDALSDSDKTHPERLRRDCTDVSWLVIFALALGSLSAALTVGGGPSAGRAVVLRDWQGRECGLPGPNARKPLLLLCGRKAPAAPGGLDFRNATALCVARCPPDGAPACVLLGSTGYASTARAGLVCVADDEALRKGQARWLAQSGSGMLLQNCLLLLQLWRPMLLCAAVAVVASGLYVAMLSVCASTLVWLGLLLLSLVPMAFGVHYLRVAGADSFTMAMGCALVLIGLVFVCVACCASYSMDRATRLLELSCRCFVSTPLLLLGPTVVLLLRYGLLFLVAESALEIYANRSSVVFVPNYVLLGYVAFMLVWINQTIDCCWDFCLALFTASWYFKGGADEKWRPTCREMLHVPHVLLRYHLGTMAKGGLVVGFFKPFRFVVGTLTAPSRLRSSIPMVSWLSEGCCCCLNDFYYDHMELLGRSFVLETALSGLAFWPAAQRSLEVLRTDDGTMGVLNGATWFFQVAGFGLVMLLGGLLTLVLVDDFPQTARGPTGGLLSKSVEVASFNWICQVICGVSAIPYFLGFETVSDAILYCHLVAKARADEEPAQGYLSQLTDYVWGFLGDAAGYAESPKVRGLQLASESSDSEEESDPEERPPAPALPEPPKQAPPPPAQYHVLVLPTTGAPAMVLPPHRAQAQAAFPRPPVRLLHAA